MDILSYIDEKFDYLIKEGVYHKERDKTAIEVRKTLAKKIIQEDPKYANKTDEEKKKIIDDMVSLEVNRYKAKLKNNDNRRKYHATITEHDSPGVTLLEKKSITTGELLEISFAYIGNNSIHLHCEISRAMEKGEDGREINHYHALLRKLKKHISEKYKTTNKEEIEQLCGREIIEPYIREVLEKVVEITEEFPHLEKIRLDTNDGFFKHLLPYINKYGFHPMDEKEKQEELKIQFGEKYDFTGDLSDFYRDYPDRKNSVEISSKELRENLRKTRKTNISEEKSKTSVI